MAITVETSDKTALLAAKSTWPTADGMCFITPLRRGTLGSSNPPAIPTPDERLQGPGGRWRDIEEIPSGND